MRRMLREWCSELRAAFVAEFKAEGRFNKTALLLLVCLPLIYTILLGAAYSANVLNDIPMVVCSKARYHDRLCLIMTPPTVLPW